MTTASDPTRVAATTTPATTAGDPTRGEQEAFLRGFHDRRPGATAAAYADGRAADGRSSYELLADLCEPGDRVLDLGAGDGYLLSRVLARGVARETVCALDLSEGELRAAGARVPGLLRVRARAQALPFAAAAFDVVLSHLAFTLMAEPAAVVAEVGRVLRPGGRFAAIVGGGPRGDDAFAGFLDLARPWMTRSRMPRLGERAARPDAGLAALLRGDFAPPAITDVAIDLSGAPDEVFARLEPAYELAALTDGERADLRAAFLAAAPRWRRPDGAIAATMAVRLVVATQAIRR